MHPIRRNEWYFPALLALLIVVAGSLPYFYALSLAGSDRLFMGFVGRDTTGANSYLAFARQAAEGYYAFTNLYTAASPDQAYVNFEWWVMGALARWTGQSLLVLFHVGRVATVLAFLLALYYFCAVTLPTVRERRAAVILICFGAGLGWLPYGLNAILGTNFPLSLDAQGVHIFGYLANKPHFIRAGLFAALHYAWFIRGEESGRYHYFALSGMAAACHSIIRPYHIPESLLFLLVYWAARMWQSPGRGGRIGRQIGLCALFHSPAILWHGVVYFRNDLGLGAFVAWNPVFLLSQILWLGFPFVACLAYGFHSLTRKPLVPRYTPILVLWLVSAALLLHAFPYFPWAVESYYPWVLAPPVLFLRYVWPRWESWRNGRSWPPWSGRVAILVVALLVAPCSALTYGKFFRDLHRPDPPEQYFLHPDTRAAIAWLAEQATEADVVLASHDTSQFIPRFAQVRVVSGQDALTRDYRQRNAHVLRFFQTPGEDDGFKRWFCTGLGVSYVFSGPFERAIAMPRFEAYPWLESVYENPSVTIYAVRLPG